MNDVVYKNGDIVGIFAPDWDSEQKFGLFIITAVSGGKQILVASLDLCGGDAVFYADKNQVVALWQDFELTFLMSYVPVSIAADWHKRVKDMKEFSNPEFQATMFPSIQVDLNLPFPSSRLYAASQLPVHEDWFPKGNSERDFQGHHTRERATTGSKRLLVTITGTLPPSIRLTDLELQVTKDSGAAFVYVHTGDGVTDHEVTEYPAFVQWVDKEIGQRAVAILAWPDVPAGPDQGAAGQGIPGPELHGRGTARGGVGGWVRSAWRGLWRCVEGFKGVSKSVER